MRGGRHDAAVSDVAGTLMMVGAVVLAGGLLTAVVTDTLSAAPPPAASFALAPVEVGDATIRLSLRHGDAIPLDKLAITLQRGEAVPVAVLASEWSTPDPTMLSAGDRLSFPLVPAAAADERLAVRVTLLDPPALLASLAATTGSAAAALGPATLAAHLTPAALYADGVAAAKLTVRVSHPAGASAVARLAADLHALGFASGYANATVALNDAGLDGDLVGGDGNWSALVRPPATTAVRAYEIDVNATSLDGLPAGRTTVTLNVTGNSAGTGGGSGGGGGGSVTGGSCYGCVVTGGVSSYEGTRLSAPTSENLSTFRLRNWTWDKLTPAKMHNDALVIRIVNGSAAWSAYFRFDYVASTPCMTYARFWTATNETVYVPRNITGTGGSATPCLPLTDLDLNLTAPVAAEQLVRVSGNADPESLYKAAGIKGHTTFILAYLRDEDPTGQDELSQEIGVFSMDVVMT